MLDSRGFPKKREVFAGNASEPKTLDKMLQRLGRLKQLYARAFHVRETTRAEIRQNGEEPYLAVTLHRIVP